MKEAFLYKQQNSIKPRATAFIVQNIFSLGLFSIVFFISMSSCVPSKSQLNFFNSSSSSSRISSGSVLFSTLNSYYVNSANYTAFPISGTCQSVTGSFDIYVGSSRLTSATCSSSGSWSVIVDFTSLSDSSYGLSVKDATGAQTYSTIYVLKDTSAPTAYLNTPPQYNNPSSSFSSSIVTTEPATYSYKLVDNSYTQPTTANINTACSSSSGYSSFISQSVSLSLGSQIPYHYYILCLVAQDYAGNIQDYNNATSYTWKYDTSAYNLNLSSSYTSPSSSLNYSFQTSFSNASSNYFWYKIGLATSSTMDCLDYNYYNLKNSTAQSSVTISGSLSAGSQGVYKICIVGHYSNSTLSLSGNSPNSYTWLVDSTAPSLSFIYPTTGSTINSSGKSSYTALVQCSEEGQAITFSASQTSGGSTNTRSPNSSPTCLNGVAYATFDLSSFSIGNFSISAVIYDSAGNTSSVTTNVSFY